MAQHQILVVEADPVERERIARELTELGYAIATPAGETAPTGPAATSNEDVVIAGGVSIDTVGHRVIVDGSFLTLAPREYDLLLFLLTHQDRVFSRKQLLLHVWGRDGSIGARTVDVHVRRLRGLLEPYRYDRYLQTVRGTGYRFSLKS